MVNATLETVRAMMMYARLHVFADQIDDPDEIEISNDDGPDPGWCAPDDTTGNTVFGIDGPFEDIDDLYLIVLHEMLHLWQQQNGVPSGHDANFIRIENDLIENTDYHDMRRYVEYNSDLTRDEIYVH